MLRISTERSVESVRAVPAAEDARGAVLALWEAHQGSGLAACQRLYVEAAALGLFGRDPYVEVVRACNHRWMAALVGYLRPVSGSDRAALRAASLVDAAFAGFLLDQPLARDDASGQAVADLADAVAALAGQGSA